MVRKSDTGKARITLGDIERGLSSGNPSPEIKAAAQDVMTTVRKVLNEANQASAHAFQNIMDEFKNSMAGEWKEIQDMVAPLIHDSKRAKRLVELVGSMNYEGVDTAFPKIQAEIDAGDSLTARQVTFLIMEARGKDVTAEIMECANSWKAFKNLSIKNSCKGAEKSTKYSNSDKAGWLTEAAKIKASKSELNSATGLANVIAKRLGLNESAIESIRKYLAANGYKRNR